MENQNTTSITIPVNQIREGFNYRRKYDPAKLASLQASIQQQGLIQPVTVRSLDDGQYQLIAGGRRLKAYVLAFGEQAQIPAIVRVLSDQEATAAMLAENNEREDPSIIEDAEGAARMVGLCKGVRDEAARRLGWSRSKLDRRLGIMNAIDKVRDAYLDDKILVGHVEILAGLRKDVQAKVIDAMLQAPECPSIEQLKAMAEQSLLNLENAIFDREECQGCQYNTGHQQSMFENSFAGTRCANKECYGKKTEEELENRRKALAETYQLVRIVRPGDDKTVLPLRAEGARGVGDEQALACRTCADFGACVSAVPESLGKSYKDVCFNKTCNDEKVAAHSKASQVKEEKSSPTKMGAGTATVSGTAAEKDGPAEKAQPAAKPGANSLRASIVEYREGVWRAIFTRAAAKLPVLQNRALLVALLLNRSGDLDGAAASEAIEKATGIKVGRRLSSDGVLQSLLTMDQATLASALQQLPGHVSKTMPIDEVVQCLKALEIKIESYWKLNEGYLNVLTKTEIDAVCVEIGLADAIGKQYDKLKNGPKADFVKSVLNVEGFAYVGHIPTMMRWTK